MLPAFIVTGAMKCATTSLHYYLDLHPDVFMSRKKELDFFIADRNWSRGVEWYESNFSGSAVTNGESSTGYTKYPIIPGVPARMHGVLPSAKLIYVVRDPVDRIVSHYIHEVAQGRESRTLDQALATLEDNPYMDISRYGLQIRQFLEFYPLDRMLVITTEDLRNHRLPTLQRVFRFLEVDDRFESENFSRILNVSSEKRRKTALGHLLSKISVRFYRLHVSLPAASRRACRAMCGTRMDAPVLDAALRRKLTEGLRADVCDLRRITGLAFDGWCL